jgi:uncharacterized protein YjcR
MIEAIRAQDKRLVIFEQPKVDKLTLKVKTLYLQGTKYSEIAEQCGVNMHKVRYIVRRSTWMNKGKTKGT